MRVRSKDMIHVCFTLVLYLTGKLGECWLDDDELNEFLQYARLRAPLSLSFFFYKFTFGFVVGVKSSARHLAE